MEPASGSGAKNAAFALTADRIFDGHRWHERAAVLIERGLVRGIAAAGDVPAALPRHDLPVGTLLAPGFIDLQVNGGGGILLNDDPTPAAMAAIARAHRRYGTTACLPTFITDTFAKAKAAIAAARVTAGKDGILGLHLEGPFISPARPGIHPPDRIASATLADLEWLTGLASAGRSLITLAPECVPAGFVRTLVGAGVRVSAGHSEASAAVMMAAIADGLSGVTHLHNAMPAMMAREPGIVGTALCEPRLTAGIIADAIHVDPLVVRASFAAKGADGIALVTDAMPTVGSTEDGFELLGRSIKLHDQKLTDQSGTLAGAHLDMASAVRIAVTLAGVPTGDALRAASLTPARYLRIDRERGSLQAGSRADLVALTPTFHALATWIGGERFDAHE
ncbi:N-acetylglucosamine-6-phosphate deacetylase [Bradyrhizobium sp. LHD-71]|uniref:N-acetylglucosamine-6-phosphate deacetylase n=1 Tax=Bradyrhizobium sp. LHD-71 TaxID=3072141 RepID=UPI00280D5AB5|nr:N-acetylglucosamine-6-phosphate deacetylase [Bradyrhizobium sp. LHD-71]MDQ8729741.1 N-acetylglucosamine-6-phosphate deacetylase [Bradyrhizobium sp. LHD-71]